MVTDKKAVVALSGGVDSSVVAILALRAGWKVIGVTLRLKHPDPDFSASQRCASKEDGEAAESVCSTLGIEHRYLEVFPQFESRVLRMAAQEYTSGRTPNPCCECNPQIKFGLLTEFARSIGASRVFTGHYARITQEHGIYELHRGDDRAKDQSYFLYRLNQEVLSQVDFPVGKLEKSEVRRIAAEHGLVTSHKPDSQDVCFQVPGESFGETLRRLEGLPRRPGNFLYHGRIVGQHAGVHEYTIGQRRGLGVALGSPAYVSRIDATTGDVVLETDSSKLFSSHFSVERLVWQSGHAPENLDNLEVQIRYRAKAVPCQLELSGTDGAMVIPVDPLRAVTPGQAAVFYRGDLLLGGGVIAHAD